MSKKKQTIRIKLKKPRNKIAVVAKSRNSAGAMKDKRKKRTVRGKSYWSDDNLFWNDYDYDYDDDEDEDI